MAEMIAETRIDLQIIGVIAEYLTREQYIPPNGTVPNSPEKRKLEWLKFLLELWDDWLKNQLREKHKT